MKSWQHAASLRAGTLPNDLARVKNLKVNTEVSFAEQCFTGDWNCYGLRFVFEDGRQYDLNLKLSTIDALAAFARDSDHEAAKALVEARDHYQHYARGTRTPQ